MHLVAARFLFCHWDFAHFWPSHSEKLWKSTVDWTPRPCCKGRRSRFCTASCGEPEPESHETFAKLLCFQRDAFDFGNNQVVEQVTMQIIPFLRSGACGSALPEPNAKISYWKVQPSCLPVFSAMMKMTVLKAMTLTKRCYWNCSV